MSKHHGTETLNFDGFSGYYGSLQQGYGGFDWSEVSFLNETYWQNIKTNWCDTGYQNALDGTGLAFTSAPAGEQTYGYIRPENVKQTFNLVSMVAASAWETNQPFKFTSYVYHPGEGFVYKASATVILSQTAQDINFATLGKAGDFKDISAVIIHGEPGGYGNTCSYGPNQHTYGYELAFDDLKIKWNRHAPTGHGASAPMHPLLPGGLHHNTPAAHLIENSQPVHAHSAGTPYAGSHHAEQNYHSEQFALSDHNFTGLTAQFHMPDIEHFGT